MMRTTARELRSSGVLADPLALVRVLGLDARAIRQPRGVVIRCPWHDDRSPSCSVRIAGDDTIAVRCHACGASGDALHLVAVAHGLDVRHDWRRVVEVAAGLAGRPLPEPRNERRALDPVIDADTAEAAYHAIWTFALDGESCECEPGDACKHRAPCELARSPHVAAYLSRRGILAHAEAGGVRGAPSDVAGFVRAMLERFERADLEAAGVLRPGHDALDWPAHPVLIPWRTRDGRISCVQRRALDDRKPKYRTPRGRSPRAPFGVELLRHAEPADEVIFVEGALDACARRSIATDERDPRALALGVYSASTPCVGLPLDALAGRRVVIATDADEAGNGAATALADALANVAGEIVREAST